MPISVQCKCGQKITAKDEHEGKRVRCPKCGSETCLPAKAGAVRDVFISYSSKDKTSTDALCATLEAHGLRCWIAPRDILPGTDWSEAIIGGIEQCRAMVLVYSSNSNDSPQVKREVERAVSKRLPIVPFRIENVPPSRSMEYFISSQHWLDALTPPLEKHLHLLAQKLQHLLANPAARMPVASPNAASVRGRGWRTPLWLTAAALFLAVIVGLGIFLLRDPAPTTEPTKSDLIAAPVDLMSLIDINRHTVRGNWTLSKEGRLQGRASAKDLAKEKTTFFVLTLPWDPPPEYRLKLAVTRQKSKDDEGSFGLGLSAGPGRFKVVFDAPRDKKHLIGLTSDDAGKLTDRPVIRPNRLFQPGIRVPLVCTVEKDKLIIESHGQRVYEWHGNLASLSRGPRQPLQPLSLQGVGKASFGIEELVLEPLGPDRGKSLLEEKE